MKYTTSPRLKRYVLVLAVTCVSAFAAGIAYYEFYVPNRAAASYEQAVIRSAAKLKRSFDTLSATADLPFLSDPYAPAAVRAKNATDTQAAIAAAIDDIGALRSAADKLETIPLSGFTGKYHAARVLREKTTKAVAQSQVVLDEYGEMVAFLEVYTRIKEDFTQQVATFNAIDDREAYAGRKRDMQAIADSIATSKNELWSLTPPEELQGMKQETFLTMDLAEKAFRRLVFGISVGVEPIIYGAVANIEKAELKNDTTDLETYLSAVNGSLAVQNLRELPEKSRSILQGR